MKSRHGFVSNSSSASFICIKCKKKYEVECRCGEPDDWEPPQGALCEKCEEKWTYCPKCVSTNNYKIYKISDMLEGVSYVDANTPFDDGCIQVNSLVVMSRHYCPKHWPETIAGKRWLEKVKDPNYVMTEEDKKIASKLGLLLGEVR